MWRHINFNYKVIRLKVVQSFMMPWLLQTVEREGRVIGEVCVPPAARGGRDRGAREEEKVTQAADWRCEPRMDDVAVVRRVIQVLHWSVILHVLRAI